MKLTSVESELKAGLAKIGSLIFTPRTKHPLLDELRQLIVQEVQAHLGIVTSGAVALGNSILQRVEQALEPAAPPANASPAKERS
jgi:glutamate 5-kinase